MQPTARPRPRGQALGREPAREDDSAGELTDKIAISLSDSVGWRHSLNSNPEETKALSTKNFREFASRIEDAGAPMVAFNIQRPLGGRDLPPQFVVSPLGPQLAFRRN